jgi:hypothetical protein
MIGKTSVAIVGRTIQGTGGRWWGHCLGATCTATHAGKVSGRDSSCELLTAEGAACWLLLLLNVLYRRYLNGSDVPTATTEGNKAGLSPSSLQYNTRLQCILLIGGEERNENRNVEIKASAKEEILKARRSKFKASYKKDAGSCTSL